MHSLARRQVVFTAGMLIGGLLAALVAFRLSGWLGSEGVVYSVLLCLVPGWLTLYISHLLNQGDQKAYVILVGTGLRMLFVLLGLVSVTALRPELGFREFTVWLLGGYLVSLALETWLVLVPASTKAA